MDCHRQNTEVSIVSARTQDVAKIANFLIGSNLDCRPLLFVYLFVNEASLFALNLSAKQAMHDCSIMR